MSWWNLVFRVFFLLYRLGGDKIGDAATVRALDSHPVWLVIYIGIPVIYAIWFIIFYYFVDKEPKLTIYRWGMHTLNVLINIAFVLIIKFTVAQALSTGWVVLGSILSVGMWQTITSNALRLFFVKILKAPNRNYPTMQKN